MTKLAKIVQASPVNPTDNNNKKKSPAEASHSGWGDCDSDGSLNSGPANGLAPSELPQSRLLSLSFNQTRQPRNEAAARGSRHNRSIPAKAPFNCIMFNVSVNALAVNFPSSFRMIAVSQQMLNYVHVATESTSKLAAAPNEENSNNNKLSPWLQRGVHFPPHLDCK